MLQNALGPGDSGGLEFGVRNHRIHSADFIRALCVVFIGEEEDFARKLLSDLSSEICRTVSSVE